jgi:uncharacterized membrane protein YhiD involved in acid resistance
MAVGVGAWLLALGATLIIWCILVVVRQFSKVQRKDVPQTSSNESKEV